jgi:hypothetical protein
MAVSSIPELHLHVLELSPKSSPLSPRCEPG